MKKIVALLVILTMLLTGCGSTTVYRHTSSTADSTEPFVSVKSSCWWGEARGKYTVSATGYGVLCSGNGYADKSKAIANPLEIQSSGYEIMVTLSDDTTESVTMVAGDTKLISCDSGSFNGYLYVIVNSSSNSETETDSESETTSQTGNEKPCISKTSSCWWGEARGKYTVSAQGYGALCSGNGYADKSKAIANPLEIQSSGYEILITLSDDSTESVTMVAGDSKLISCKSGSFNGFLYVIVI